MLAALDARLNSMGCHPPGSPNTPDFTADPCAPSKDARATIALETAKRRVAALERQADQARTDMLEAWGRMQSPAILDASAQSDVEAAEVALARAEATVAELARDIERAKKREAWLKDAATRVTGAERESWEKSARDEWMKYTVLEQQDLPRARRTVDRARAALAKERSEAPQARAAYEAAKARYQAARTSFESVLVQIEQAIAAVLAQAADLEKWALAERLTLARCRDHFPQEHYKRAIDKALADLGADPSGQCSPASPQPGTKGIAGHIGGVANQIGAAGCR
jgi:hypothetical protein